MNRKPSSVQAGDAQRKVDTLRCNENITKPNLEVLQKLGGWEKLEMVLKYAHLAPEHLAGYANNFVTRNLPHINAEQAPEPVLIATRQP